MARREQLETCPKCSTKSAVAAAAAVLYTDAALETHPRCWGVSPSRSLSLFPPLFIKRSFYSFVLRLFGRVLSGRQRSSVHSAPNRHPSIAFRLFLSLSLFPLSFYRCTCAVFIVIIRSPNEKLANGITHHVVFRWISKPQSIFDHRYFLLPTRLFRLGFF